MTHEDFMLEVSKLFPLIDHAQAEHTGSHFASFFGNEEILLNILKARDNSFSSVNLAVDRRMDKIVYRLYVMHDCAEKFLKELKAQFHV